MNLFGITSIMIFFAGLGFGLFLYSSNRQSKINQAWFIVSIFVALWGLALYGVTSTASASTALHWQYLLDISAIMIPVTYFAFVCELLHLTNYFLRRGILYIGMVLAIFTVTPLFKEGMTTRYGFFWVNPGPYYILFPIFFFVTVIVSLTYLLRGYFSTTDMLVRAQIRNTLLAGIIGFGGGLTNFFPQVINIYPFGNYFVLLYVFFMSYGVLKYKLLSRKIISAQLLTAGMVLIFLFNLLQVSSLVNWLVNFMLFVLVLVFSILLVQGMYREVEQREKIEELAKDLEKANMQQEGLIHFITHQIKGFFTKSRDIYSMALEGDFGELPVALQPIMKEGLDSETKGVALVKEILDSANLKKGTIRYMMKPFDFKPLVENIAVEQKKIAESKGLSFDMNIADGDYTIVGDSEQLKHVVRNVIDNSIKYTPEGGLTVSLSADEKKVTFTVKDTGVGVTAEDRPQLFTAGGKGKNSIKVNVESTGFGLFIVKEIIDAHKGMICVNSDGAGKGTTFCVELPKKPN